MSVDISHRLAREEDLPALRLIQGCALRDLHTRQGGNILDVPLDDVPTPLMRYLLRTGPDLSWVAIRNGRPVGFSQGFVRGDLWFLSNLFVDPETQGTGVGAALLERCLEAGLRRGARIRAVSSSADPSAHALYARAGMVPRFPLFALQGPVRALRELPAVKARVTQTNTSNVSIRKLGALDEYVWGHRRDADHRFARQGLPVTCITSPDSARRLAGYVYYAADQAGPLAARTPRLQLQLLRAVGDALGDEGVEKFRLTVPGINATVLVALLKVGFRIDFSNLFMSSRSFGRFDRYVASGGTLL